MPKVRKSVAFHQPRWSYKGVVSFGSDEECGKAPLDRDCALAERADPYAGFRIGDPDGPASLFVPGKAATSE